MGIPKQHSNADSGYTVTIDPEVIRERTRLIRADAPCVGCGARLEDCEANRGKDPTAPPWFGCCARGTGMAPCSHRDDPDALAALVDEMWSGNVRPTEEIRAERKAKREARRGKPTSIVDQFDQGKWWRRKNGEWVKVADMSPSHRYNTAAMLMRSADRYAMSYSMRFSLMVSSHDGGEMAHDALESEADRLDEMVMRDPRGWLRGTTLYQALTAGLTVQGDGTEPWQKTGRDPEHGEPVDVPARVKVAVARAEAAYDAGTEHA